MPKTTVKSDLQRHIDKLVKEHGSLRKAGNALQIDATYLWRIQQGKVLVHGDKALARIGLKRPQRLVAI